VTLPAELAGVGKLGHDASWVVGVFGQRPVAGFAVQTRVLAFALQFGLVAVAGLAGFVARELRRVGGNLGHGRGPIVTILAEALRYDVAANAPEDQESDYKQACKAKKMSSIFE